MFCYCQNGLSGKAVNLSSPIANVIECHMWAFLTCWSALPKSNWELCEILDFQGPSYSWGQRRFFLRAKNTKQWCPPTTIAASHHCLTYSPLAKTTSRWTWLAVVCLGAGWMAPRRLKDNGGHHGWEVCLAHFVLIIFCCSIWCPKTMGQCPSCATHPAGHLLHLNTTGIVDFLLVVVCIS